MENDELEHRVVTVLRNALAIDESVPMPLDTGLLGSMPQLDSLSLVAVLTSLEQEFDFYIEDDEVGAEMFATIATLCDFVRSKRSNVGDFHCARSS